MHIRSRFLHLIFCFIFLSSLLLLTVGCGSAMDAAPTPSTPPTSEQTPENDKIRIPTLRDYPDRRTVKFDTIDYVAPDFDGSTSAFLSVIDLIEKNEVPYPEQLTAIQGLWSGYEQVQTMHTLAQLAFRKDSENTTVREEYERVSARYPAYAQTIEKLYVACAKSPRRESFEADYFREDISSYADGGILTDAVVALMSEQTRLQNEYSALSSAPTVTLDGVSDTLEGHLAAIQAAYEIGTAAYQKAYFALELAYRTQVQDPIEQIYTDLVRTRRSIADALGDENYLTYAYDSLGYEYTVAEMRGLIESIVKYVVPVYTDREFFNAYFLKMQNHTPQELSKAALINGYYDAIVEKDKTLAQIFDYMLQFELYDIEKGENGRFDGAFTTYLNAYDAPYLFISATQTSTDYLTLAHEFGHYADFFQNGASDVSLDLSEVYSQGLELLSLHALAGRISPETEVYLKYNALYSALSSLVVQGYYAAFELAVYELPYEAITKEGLDTLAKTVAAEFGFSGAERFTLYDCIIPHTALYPTYVQSYCTSTVPALALYLMECDTAGEGFRAYTTLLSREEGDESFLSIIAAAGLDSPFNEASIKQIADEIYFEFLGKHFYFSAGNNNAA